MSMNNAYYELRESLQNEIKNFEARRGQADKNIILIGSKEFELFQNACANLYGVQFLQALPHNDEVYIFVRIYKTS